MQNEHFPESIHYKKQCYLEPFKFDQCPKQDAVYVKPTQNTPFNILPPEKNYLDMHVNSKHYFPNDHGKIDLNENRVQTGPCFNNCQVKDILKQTFDTKKPITDQANILIAQQTIGQPPPKQP